MSDEAMAYMVMPHEAEYMVENVTPLSLEAMGSADFIRLHSDVEKLNLQAHQSAKQKADNFVIESILTFKKLPVLVHNMLVNELWKEHVFPTLDDVSDAASMRTYFVLYHEAVLCNLLEVAFYHEHVIESLDDETLIEVLDYCMRKITWLIRTPREVIRTKTTFHKSGHDIVRELDAASRKDELHRQWLEMEFRLSVQCVAILRYMCERVHVLSLNVLTRLLDKHDALLSFVALIENPPWTYKTPDSNQWKKFQDQKWAVVDPCDLLQITTTEAQPWIGVYFLVCSKVARDQYQLTSFRKNQVLRIRKYLNDVMLDQLPLLADVQRFLDELAIVQLNPNAVSSAAKLVMEVVPVIRTALLREYRTRYAQLGLAYQAACAEINRKHDMHVLADVYNMQGIDDLLDGGGGSLSVDAVLEPSNQDVDKEYVAQEARRPVSVDVVISSGSQKIVDTNNHAACCLTYEVDMTSEKAIETTDGTYARYSLRAVSSKGGVPDDAIVAVSNHARIHATIGFADDAMPPIQLQNPDVNLPMANDATAKPVWRQVGILDQGNGVVQIQFKIDPATDAHVMGSLFLSLPRMQAAA